MSLNLELTLQRADIADKDDGLLRVRSFGGDAELLQEALQQRSEMLTALGATTRHFVTRRRLRCGGALSALSLAGSTDLALHPQYGFPLLRASGLKGILRHYLCDECKDGEATAEEWFGTTRHAGKVVLFDAWPADPGPWIERDVLTPHPPASGKGMPTPITLPVVKAGVRFLVAWQANGCTGISHRLPEALDRWGFGGGTGRGFGRMTAV